MNNNAQLIEEALADAKAKASDYTYTAPDTRPLLDAIRRIAALAEAGAAIPPTAAEDATHAAGRVFDGVGKVKGEARGEDGRGAKVTDWIDDAALPAEAGDLRQLCLALPRAIREAQREPGEAAAAKLRKIAEAVEGLCGSDAVQQATKGTAAGVTQQEVKRLAIAIVEAEGWMSERKLATRIGCDRKTVARARANSPYLKARRAEAEASKPATDAQDRRDALGSAKLAAGELADESAEDPHKAAELAELIADHERDERRERRGLA